MGELHKTISLGVGTGSRVGGDDVVAVIAASSPFGFHGNFTGSGIVLAFTSAFGTFLGREQDFGGLACPERR